ncbi:HNH endonuclease signature motif containing protein [Bernardetia sp. Wsw4-3y2]|uniref:HNH endonuclease n=1 Tax=Bernardetia sp. Wsw4-3y2 TaxID=3127471 RepID=UPI0030CAB749
MKAIKEKFKNGNPRDKKKWENIETEYINLILPVCESCENGKVKQKKSCSSCNYIGYEKKGFLLKKLQSYNKSNTQPTIKKLSTFLIEDLKKDEGILKGLLTSEEFDYNNLEMDINIDESRKVFLLLFPKLVLEDYFFQQSYFKSCVGDMVKWSEQNIITDKNKNHDDFKKSIYDNLIKNSSFLSLLDKLGKNISAFDKEITVGAEANQTKIKIKETFCNSKNTEKYKTQIHRDLESLYDIKVSDLLSSFPQNLVTKEQIFTFIKTSKFISKTKTNKNEAKNDFANFIEKKGIQNKKTISKNLISEIFHEGHIDYFYKIPNDKLEEEIKKIINKIFDNTLSTLLYEKIFKYTDLQKMHGGWFADKLGIKACPYCNNQWVLSVDKDDKGKLKPKYQLDHIKPKSIFPHLAISLYNLVPSCANCNLAKGDSYEDFFNPYSESFHDNAKFELLDKKGGFIYDLSKKKDLKNSKLSLSCAVSKKLANGKDNPDYKINSQKVEKHKEKFALDEIYTLHKDIIEEIYAKRYIYKHNNTWRDKIKKMLEGFDKTINGKNLDHEIDRFIYGTYTKSSDFHKRIHTKLHNDIIEELEKYDALQGSTSTPKSI